MFDKYGIDNCCIEKLEDVSFNDIIELRQRERYYIDNNKCLNIIKPSRTPKQYRQETKERRKKYLIEYYKNHGPQIRDKEQLKIYQTEYFKKNKEKHDTIIPCDCGATYRFRSKYSHTKTKAHLAYLSTLSSSTP
jgi:hypothetical protein